MRRHSIFSIGLLLGLSAIATAKPVDWPAAQKQLSDLVATGQFKKANDFAGETMRQAGGKGEAVNRTRFDLLRSRLLMYTRYGDDADQAIARAAALAEANDDALLKADLAATRAKLAGTKRDSETAFAEYDKAIAGYQEAGDAAARAEVLADAIAFASDRDPKRVETYAAPARTLLRENPNIPAAPRLGTALAEAATDPADAVKQWTAIAAAAEGRGDARTTAAAWSRVATYYENANQPADALVAARRGLFAAQKADAGDIQFRLDWQIGRLQKAKSQNDSAIDSYFRSVRGLQNVRHDLLVHLARTGTTGTFRERIGPVYYQLADLLIKRSETRTDPADQQNDLRLARQVVEQLKTVELEDYFQDQCVNLAKEQERIVDKDLQNAAVIYYIPLADRTEILVTTPSGRLERVTSNVTDQQISETARQFRFDATNRRNANYRKTGRQLYDWLVAPIEPIITSQQAGEVKTLVILPDGDLRSVPMAALWDGKQFLVEKYAIAISPGLTLMRPEPLDRTGRQIQVLKAGVTTERTVGKTVFAALPNVSNELDQINDLYPGTLLKDEGFRNRPFEQSLEENAFTIVHIASHGQFKADSRDTFILTYDSTLSLDMLEKLMLPSKFREQPIELLTLSACQTAAGDDGSRAALGMAGIAVKAGARSAMATLWFVSDEASSELVTQFYGNLRDNPQMSRAEAMRRAQQHVLAIDRFRHPYYWAPFLMIGNWK
jgi:CHAT domain-containing protein